MRQKNFIGSPQGSRVERSPRELEKSIWQHTQFKDIDIRDPNHRYHYDMLHGLIYQAEGEQSSLIRNILAHEDMLGSRLEHVIVEAVVVADISFNVGTKRNVDRFSFVFAGGKRIVMTVSLDREPADRASESASADEARTLSQLKQPVPTFQAYFGSKTIPYESGKRTIICKEYLPGLTLCEVIREHDLLRDPGKAEMLSVVMRSVAMMVAITIRASKGMPVDSHFNNIIIAQTEAGEVSGRYCDVENLRTDHVGIRDEVFRCANIFGIHDQDFLGMVDEEMEYV